MRQHLGLMSFRSGVVGALVRGPEPVLVRGPLPARACPLASRAAKVVATRADAERANPGCELVGGSDARHALLSRSRGCGLPHGLGDPAPACF